MTVDGHYENIEDEVESALSPEKALELDSMQRNWFGCVPLKLYL